MEIMNSGELIQTGLIGVGLAMDAFAVSITCGVAMEKMRLRHAMWRAGCFGFFQALMPVLGWLGGGLFRDYAQSFDHWLAFGLLSLIGGKMIYESFKLKEDGETFDPLNVYILFTLAVATSIDALAVGITFSFLGVNIWEASAIIGAITFVICLIGTRIGKTFGHMLENKMEMAGGLVLIGIGVKILLEHLLE